MLDIEERKKKIKIIKNFIEKLFSMSMDLCTSQPHAHTRTHTQAFGRLVEFYVENPSGRFSFFLKFAFRRELAPTLDIFERE